MYTLHLHTKQTLHRLHTYGTLPLCLLYTATMHTLHCHYAYSTLPLCILYTATMHTLHCHYAYSTLPPCILYTATMHTLHCHHAYTTLPPHILQHCHHTNLHYWWLSAVLTHVPALSCSHEYIDIFTEAAGPDKDLLKTPFGGRYCGKIPPRLRISWHRTIHIGFFTDNNGTTPDLFSGKYEFINESEFHCTLIYQ